MWNYQMTYNNQNNPRKQFFNLEVATTSSCNMQCTYCFEGEELKSNKIQPEENINAIIEKIDNLLSSERFSSIYGGVCINFWGGEPTLNFSWNKELITKCKELFKDRISFFIYSNGYNYLKVKTHIDLFSREELLKDVLRLQISWDGIDNGRIDHSKRKTNDMVGTCIQTLALVYPELNLTTKATIQPEELLRLEQIWNNYFELFKLVTLGNEPTEPTSRVPAAKNRTTVSFSPTLNYVDDFDTQDEVYLNNIKVEFSKVLVLEEAFYKKYGFHLFGWFSESLKDAKNKRMTNCSAGINLAAVDYEGNLSICHGTLYSDLKTEFIQFQNNTIHNEKDVFLTKFFDTRAKIEKHHSYVSDECIGCSATVCYKCPVVNLEQIAAKDDIPSKDDMPTKEIKPNEFQIRDPRHCGIYKLFGKFDRVLINKIHS